MKKLKLEELAVDSFAVADEEGECGTVLAHGFEETGATVPCDPTCNASCRLCWYSDVTQCYCTYQYGNC